MNDNTCTRRDFLKQAGLGIAAAGLGRSVMSEANAAPAAAKSATRPNVLIYFIDELRADALGCYGHPFIQTPAIDRIAAQGMRFDRAISNCPLCMPARNCFFTGQYAGTHGLLSNGPVKTEFPEIAERYRKNPPLHAFGRILRDAGFEDIINVGKHHTGFSSEISGFTQHHETKDKLGAAPPRLPKGSDPKVSRPIVVPGQPPHTIIGGTYDRDPSNTHSAHTVEKAMDVLKKQSGDAPWCLRVSINRPHTPVLAPPPYDTMYADQVRDWEFNDEEFANRTGLVKRWSDARGFQDISLEDQRRARASYFGLTSFVDSQIGKLEQFIANRGLDDNLITIFVADHGASIGEHGLQVKGPFDTDDIARVPFLMRYPGRIPAGTAAAALTQIIDIVPTLADLLGVETPKTVEGKSLTPVLDNPKATIHDAIYSDADWPHGLDAGRRESIRTDDWLYTRYTEIDERELFDLNNDPGQTRNIAGDRKEITKRMEARLDAWKA